MVIPRSSLSLSRRRQKGMGLIEVMTVAAIIAILATIALPAYNMYALRAKFAEVVSASAPTKTAIATCVGTNACSTTNGVVSVAGNSAGSVSFPLMTTTTNSDGTTTISAIPATAAQMWALIVGYWDYQNSDMQQAVLRADEDAQAWANGTWTLAEEAGSDGLYCGQIYYPATSTAAASLSGCLTPVAPLATILKYYNSSVDTYWSNTDTADLASGLQVFPCVGSVGCSPSTKYIATVTYATNGTITATATTFSGLNSETFILTPVYSSGSLDWQVSGTCKTRAGGALC